MPETSASDNYTKQRDADIALSTELHKSSAQEYDKQLVYLAGGGLALTLTFAKDIASITSSHFILLLFLTWIAFALALLFNLFSHREATATHDLARSLHLYLRDCHTSGTPQEVTKRVELDRDLRRANQWLRGYNKAAEYSVVVGIGAFILFVGSNVYSTMSKPNNKPAPAPSAQPRPGAPQEGTRGIPAHASVMAPPPPPAPAAPASSTPQTNS